MAWSGYFTYDGSEVINATRTEAYVRSAGVHWFRPQYENDSLPVALGDDQYKTPLVDNAPWVDEDNLASLDFWGVYPLNVVGIEDSSRSSTVTESLGEGANPGRLRNGSKEILFTTVLLSGTEAGAIYGFNWLKQVLLGGACGSSFSSSCTGGQLCYLNSAPELDLTTSAMFVPGADGSGGTGNPGGVITQALIDGGSFTTTTSANPDDWAVSGGNPSTTYVDETSGGGPGFTYTDVLDGGIASGVGFVDPMAVTDNSVDDPDLDGGTPGSEGVFLFDGGSAFATGTVANSADFPWFVLPSDTPPVAASDPNASQVVEVFAPAEDCLTPLMRSLRKVAFNNGPLITSKRTTSDGCEVWTVEFTGVAGNPYELSAEVPVIAGFMDPRVDIPWVGGVIPDGGSMDMDGYLHDEDACAVRVYAPLYDPLAPAQIAPPGPPNVPLGFYTPPSNWQRRQFTIPKQFIPSWGEVVPEIKIHAPKADMRNLRLRFYADPDANGDITDDPCAYCGDIVVSFIPANHTLVLNGAEETVYVDSPGGARRRADSLVFRTDGGPFDWPSLTCGYGYIVTIDLPQTQATPVVDLSLYSRAA